LVEVLTVKRLDEQPIGVHPSVTTRTSAALTVVEYRRPAAAACTGAVTTEPATRGRPTGKPARGRFPIATVLPIRVCCVPAGTAARAAKR
jgi:hypothetical protein